MSMDNIVKEQFDKVIEGFFWTSEKERQDNTEIIIKEWDKISYLSSSKWKTHELGFRLDDSDLVQFQQDIIKEKFAWEEKMLEDFYYEFKKKWHTNYSYEYGKIPLRINWSIWRGKSYMRIRKLPSKMFKPEDLWIPGIIEEEIRKYKEGWLVIVSARPGSWKSTTIASVLQKLFDEETINIVTLEDPIEYIYRKDSKAIIQQREKVFDFDDFDTWVEACMRQTPDIVVVQEMTTPKIVREVMKLVEKGVMVITTLHTSDTTSIFESILWSYDNSRRKEILNKLSTLFRCFISQRLITAKEGKWKVAVFEVLVNTNEVKWFITWDTTKNLAQVMVRKPHLLMSESIVDRVEDEKISLVDWLEACPYSRQRDLKDRVNMD